MKARRVGITEVTPEDHCPTCGATMMVDCSYGTTYCPVCQEMICEECGSPLEEHIEQVGVPMQLVDVNGEEIEFEDVLLFCMQCEE